LSYINKIAQALPKFKHSQSDILQYMIGAYHMPKEFIGKATALYSRSDIDYRFSVLPDFDLGVQPTLFKEANINMQSRMEVYMPNALQLGAQAFKELNIDSKEVTHLITVSCTGMAAPGLDVLLMQQVGLNPNVVRTSVNFMGCYAAVHALKLANAFCALDKNAKVAIVLVELCTLHFQHTFSIENVATSMLFGDGCAAILVSNQASEASVKIKGFYSEIKPSTLQDMTWGLSDTGFLMTLSAYVPDILGANIMPLLNNALNKFNIKKESITNWAIHPGGKKIITEIVKALSISEVDVVISRNVLKEFGNLSSATLPLVIDRHMSMMNKGDIGFGCAFGPGLTMETILFEK
jgi:predicted naringenin-chalcone synthase